MAKKGPRILIDLECSECKSQNYITQKNRTNTQDKLELKKFCKHCRKTTLHKEVKKQHSPYYEIYNFLVFLAVATTKVG